MNIKEIDGKKYIEYDQDRKQKIRTIMNTCFLILMLFAIIGLFGAVINLIKHKDLYQNEPVTYVMERYKMTACACLDSEGKEWYSGEEGWKPHYGKSNFVDYMNNDSSGEINISIFGGN